MTGKIHQERSCASSGSRSP